MSFGQFAGHLSKYLDQPSKFPNLTAYQKAYFIEQALDFNKVEVERTAYLTALTTKLSPSQLQSLIAASASYRQGKTGNADFYQHLLAMGKAHNLSLKPYPRLLRYTEYLNLSEALNGESLFEELSRAEKTTFQKLVRDEDEKNLINESNLLRLTSRLIDFSLSPEEWKDYKKAKSAAPPKNAASNLSSFEKFYESAELRDSALTQNLLSKMHFHHKTKAVLITGGFHSAGIKKILLQQSKTSPALISFTPKITQIKADAGNDTNYLTVFSREKTPLEELFKGEKLFLAKSPFGAAPQVKAVAASTALGLRLSPQKTNALIAHLKKGLRWTKAAVTTPTQFLVRLSGVRF